MHSTVNGISINFEIDGPEGAPWLVFSNSLLTNLSMWDDQVAELKQSYRCLRYDQRGHGGTQATEGHYSFDLLVADIIRAARYAGDQARPFLRPVHGRHDGLVPGAAPSRALRSHHRLRLRAGLHAGLGATVEGAYRARVQGRRGGPGREHHCALVPPEFLATKSPVLDNIRQMIRSTPIAGFCGCAQALSDYDLRPGLAGIDLPTLLMVGTKDATLAGIRQIKEAVPRLGPGGARGRRHIAND